MALSLQDSRMELDDGVTDTINLSPDFIRYLFSNKPKFDCYFKVGNTKQGEPERIGAVKLMLMAHSEVFRLELEDSDLKDKETVPIPDIHPDTFKGLLKYVYGHDRTTDMSFDEADNLLYVAEKYMIKTLKNKLAVRLMGLLNTDNICSLLNNPACYRHLELDNAITDILRNETDQVLASPQFLCMDTDGFLKILQQDGLAVAEIDLWRAAIKWAKHRANSEEGHQLRGQLGGLTKHLRICTLTLEEIATEVVTTDVLTDNESVTVIKSVVRREKPQNLCEFSDEILPRKILKRNKLDLTPSDSSYHNNWTYNLILQTKNSKIELLPLLNKSKPVDNTEPENQTYDVTCSTTITKTNKYKRYGSSTGSSTIVPPITVNVRRGVEFEIPLILDGKNITLQPNTKYSVRIHLYGNHLRYRDCRSTYSNDHLELQIHDEYDDDDWDYECGYAPIFVPCAQLQYRVVT